MSFQEKDMKSEDKFLKGSQDKVVINAEETVIKSSEGKLINCDNDINKENSLDDTCLPKSFTVKYLGKKDASGLWGIKHTRKPVDDMVLAAKQLKPGTSLPFLKLTVTEKGVEIEDMPQNTNKDFQSGLYSIELISYGVQDLVYTRVFAMIVVREGNLKDVHPFECHAFVCDSRQSARRLTFSLASSFQLFSKTVTNSKKKPKKFAIDLRSPEEIEADMKGAPEQDSEA